MKRISHTCILEYTLLPDTFYEACLDALREIVNKLNEYGRRVEVIKWANGEYSLSRAASVENVNLPEHLYYVNGYCYIPNNSI